MLQNRAAASLMWSLINIDSSSFLAEGYGGWALDYPSGAAIMGQSPTTHLKKLSAGYIISSDSEKDVFNNDGVNDFGSKTFSLIFDTTSCTMCGVRASKTTAPISPNDPPNLEIQLRLLDNIKWDSVSNKENIAVTFKVFNDVPLKGKVIQWNVTFAGDNLRGPLPLLTVDSSNPLTSANDLLFVLKHLKKK